MPDLAALRQQANLPGSLLDILIEFDTRITALEQRPAGGNTTIIIRRKKKKKRAALPPAA